MHLRFKITLVYTLIVTIIVFLVCTAIYIFSVQNREVQFKSRLVNKAASTNELLLTKGMDTSDIRKFNDAPSAIYNKSVYVFNTKGAIHFYYNDDGVEPLNVPPAIINKARLDRVWYYKHDNRDVAAVNFRNGDSDYIVVVAGYDIDKVEWMSKLLVILLICFISSIAVVIISGYIFSLSIVSTIRGFNNKIDKITSEQLSMRLDAGDGKDDLQKLAITINNLLDRLQFSFDTQRRFIDNASHELSTPLAAVSSQLDVALQRDRDPEGYKKVLLSVKDDIKRLSLLLRSLLEIAKASGSEGGIELASVNIDELVVNVSADIKKISQLYDVDIVFDVAVEDNTEYMIYGNYPLLFSAVRNIVHNACKYSKDKKADVSLSHDDNYIIIDVEDRGPGIPAEELKHIFQPFYRGSKYNNLITGTGLGLALAYHIIGLHKGHIQVQSTVGKGSTFTIYLPR